ncbi:hypothetical protein [Corynebacterium sp. NML120713]|uniref:hypothetical protein n=1 Tax=Corynebacterium sp. NML120713 TaxID=1906332 RepID=UPI0008FB215C|nr:hypothetical protein [Corynebacterium sp. NML120713]OIR43197.1 hypothetical protein BJP06_06350 [Corynebacterium sp. NML120713]
MTEQAIKAWFLDSSPSQFILGVLVLIFGAQKILSAENLEKSLGGLVLPVRWMHKRRQRAAEEEITTVQRLRAEVNRQAAEIARYHEWSIMATRRNQDLESTLTAHGVDIPPPNFVYLHEFGREKRDRGNKEEEEEGE